MPASSGLRLGVLENALKGVKGRGPGLMGSRMGSSRGLSCLRFTVRKAYPMFQFLKAQG